MIFACNRFENVTQEMALPAFTNRFSVNQSTFQKKLNELRDGTYWRSHRLLEE